MERARYRIFMSSPGDVRPERAIAERVVAKLAREFAHHCDLEAVLWEREPLTAAHHFQDIRNIPPPRSADICVVVLWSRLGVPLPEAEFRGALSGKAVTGTEWEFEDALASYRLRGAPDLLVYRKSARVLADAADEKTLDETRGQLRLLQSFFERWFKTADGASFTLASHVFESTAVFEGQFEEHLRSLIRRRLGKALGEQAEIGSITWMQAPWRGLAAFDLEQSSVFFGRTRARNELREMLARQSAAGRAFVLVIGASGSGKSSLVKAGLVPDLKLPGMIGRVALVRHALLRPVGAGTDPLLGLAQALMSESALPELADLSYTPNVLADQLRDNPKQVSFAVSQGLAQAARGTLSELGEARLLLVVDQLEELFTAERITPEQRTLFVTALESLATSGEVWVLATLRSDFFDRLESLPALAALSESGRYLLVPPTAAEIAQIVRGPARAAGLQFEIDANTGEGLDDQIVRAAARDPGALPLLSFALDQLWQHRDTETGRLTFAGYRAMGGFEGAIGRRAEELFAALSPEEQAAFPTVLQALVTVGQGAGGIATARSASLDRFEQGSAAWRMVQAFLAPEARLFVAEGDGPALRMRIAHEALLSHWTRAREEITTRREDLQRRARVEAAAGVWSDAPECDKPERLLSAGLELSEAEVILERYGSTLENDVHEFIRESQDAASRLERAKLRRTRIVAGILAGIAFVAVGAGIWALRQEALAKAALLRATGLKLATEGQAIVADTNPGHTLRGALEILASHQIDSGAETYAALQFATQRLYRMVKLIETPAPVFAMATSPDGKRVAFGSTDQMLRLWDVATGRPIGDPLRGHESRVTSVAFSPDGKRLVSGSVDKTLRLWDAATGRPIGAPLRGHEREVFSVAFSPDGKRVVSGSADTTLRLWDPSTGSLMGEPLRGHDNWVVAVAFSPDGKQIVSGSRDKTLRLWDAATGRPIGGPLRGHEEMVLSAAFSPEGKRVVSGSEDKTLRLWDVATGRPIGEPLRGHERAVLSVAFSPDGKRVVSGSDDKTVRLWDAATGRSIGEPLRGHENAVFNVAPSSDGRRIASGSSDKTIRLWDAAEGGSISEPLRGHESWVTSVAFNFDGKRVVSGSRDKTLRIWDTATGRPIGEPLRGHEQWVFSVALSHDGKRIVSGSSDSTLRLWDLVTGSPIGEPLRGYDNWVVTVAFSPDGKRIVSGGFDNTLRVWDATTGRQIGEPLRGHQDVVSSVAFSPDGKRVVSGSQDRTLRLWDAATGRPIGEPLRGHESWVTSVAFSPDGKRLVSGSWDKTLRLWDAATGRPIGEPLRGHEDAVFSVAFSLDGKRVVSGSQDGTLRLWDVAMGRPIGEPLRGHEGAVLSVAFSPDNKHVVSGSNDETLRLWLVLDSWADELCRKLPRNMSGDEWRRWVGDIPYQRQCPDLPTPADLAPERR